MGREGVLQSQKDLEIKPASELPYPDSRRQEKAIFLPLRPEEELQ